jgi:phage terminase large subunit-like protein
VVGLGIDEKAYVLADLTCSEQPAEWGRIAVQAFVDFEADEILVEKNFGGDMATETVKVAAEHLGVAIDVVDVNVTRGKQLRAQPVAALYGRPGDETSWRHTRVHHVGGFPNLHDEQTNWTHKAKWSPNRIDGVAMGVHRLLLMDEPDTGIFWGS